MTEQQKKFQEFLDAINGKPGEQTAITEQELIQQIGQVMIVYEQEGLSGVPAELISQILQPLQPPKSLLH